MNVVELIFFTALMLACLWIAEHVAPYLHGSIYLAFTLVLWVFLISAPASRRIGDLLVGVKKSYPKDDSHKWRLPQSRFKYPCKPCRLSRSNRIRIIIGRRDGDGRFKGD